MPQLPHPSEDLVRSFTQRFDQSQVVVERALELLIRSFPENTSQEEVLLKVVALNGLYGTNIFATSTVAEHIVSLDVDQRLQTGQPEAVELIACVRIGSKTRINYSFATKYCFWHNPGAYSIFDSYVEQMLWGYQSQDGFSSFRRQDLRSYPSFRQVITDFRRHYRLEMFDAKAIDNFLWLAGKEQFPASWMPNSTSPTSRDTKGDG